MLTLKSGHVFICAEFESCKGVVQAIRKDGAFVDEIRSGDEGGIILDQTCFYAEQGGQIYDTGVLVKDGDEVSAVIRFSTSSHT
jgi:alanyl-tRNA synthetase